MAKTPAESKAGSLKAKIRLSMAALAFLIALIGLADGYLKPFFGNSFFAAFAPFLLIAATVFFFGRWLANVSVAPVEQVALLAKSFERGVSTSVPKTSGAFETDELLESVVRLNYQIQKLIALMDEVAAGNLNVTLSSKNASDRIIQTFQKLLAKVSESIHARQELERLERSIARLVDEASLVKHGNLDAKVTAETDETKEVSEVLQYLLERLGEIVLQAKASSRQIGGITAENQKTIQAIIRQDESRLQEMTQASVTLKQVPNLVQKILAELSQSSASAEQSIEKAQNGTHAARKNLTAVGSLRHQIREAVKHIQSLGERSKEINKIAKTIDDLAQRTTMVALNASVQANELGKAGRGFVVVSEEIEHLAKRAINMNGQISSLHKTIQAEIGEAENALNRTVQEAANLSKFAIETGTVLEELERQVAGFLNLQNKIAAFSSEQTVETEKAFQVFVAGISETENSLLALKEIAGRLPQISAAIEDLQSLAQELRISTPDDNPGAPNETASTPDDYSNYLLSEENISA